MTILDGLNQPQAPARKGKPDVQIQAIIQVGIKDEFKRRGIPLDDITAMHMAQSAMAVYITRRDK